MFACFFVPPFLNAATKSHTPSVLVSGPVLPGIGTEVQSESLSTLPDWMIGMSAGEQLIMPMSPWANCFQRSVRFLVPGLGSVAPDFTRSFMYCTASTFCELSIVHLPDLSW